MKAGAMNSQGRAGSRVTLLLAFAALLAAAVPAFAQTLAIGANSNGAGDATGNEGDSVSLTVKMSASSTSAVTVKWRYVSGGTASSSDYSHDGGTSAQNLSFAAGQTSKTVSIDLVNDDLHEVAESFQIELYDASGATISRSRVTITIQVDPDNPDLPTFTLQPTRSVDEEDGTVAVRVVHTAFASDVADITIAYQMAGITATAGDDFTAASGTLTFPKGSRTTQTIDIPILEDTLAEPDETFEVRFGAPSVGSIVQSQAKTTVTIVDRNTRATGDPTISGPAQVGMTLSASTSAIMDANGLTGATYAYQWIRETEGGTETNVGTDSSSYTLTSSDQGHHMKVKVTFTDDGSTEETRTSGQTFLVMPASSSNCVAGTIWCGVLTVGHALDDDDNIGFGPGYGSLDDATFTHRGVNYTITALRGPSVNQRPLFFDTTPDLPADAAGNVTLHMQKYSGELSLPFTDAEFQSGSNAWAFYGALFVPPSGSLSDQPLLKPYSRAGADRLAGQTDIDTKIAVRLSAIPNTAATGKPSIAGFPRVGGQLRAGLGTIADTGGLPETFPDDYDLQWVRVNMDGVSNPTDIAGATSGTYTPVAADLDKKLKLKVSFTDGEGVAEGPLESEATAAVRDASAPLLETTLTVGRYRNHRGCHEPNTVNPCAELMGQRTFVSTDRGGVQKEFTIAGLQTSDVGVIPGRGDFGTTMYIWFEGTRELRDYEVNNLVLVLDGTRFLFRNADAGGYHLRQWQNTSLNWTRGQVVDVQILDEPGAREQQVLPPLTASFENLPASHDGSSPFSFRMSFSAEVTIEPAAMRDQALLVSDGTVTGASRVDGRKDLWEFTVQPAGNGAVSILVPLDRACTETGALCTADGRKLSTGVPAQVVPGPTQNQQQAVALTASFEDVPAEHDGSSVFTMRLRFSEALASGGARGRVERTLSATGGAVQRVSRVDQRRDLFDVPIQPSGHGAVTVSLPPSASCDITDALCTADNRPLSNALSVLVQGPPSLSVADAEVEEGPSAALAFTVTLGRAATAAVTIGYATADGSATAGSDYTATSGTLSFAVGETEKTVSVPVIDDSHNEGDETLTLTLSNASGAWIEDGSATGTIKNHDPLPAAFIARFGRATAEQVVQHVEERMAAPRERGFRARFAGREFRPGMERDFALGFLSGFGQPMGASPMGGHPAGASAVGGAPMGPATMGAHVSPHGAGAPGMAGGLPPAGAGAAPMPGHDPSTGHGGGFLGSFLPGGGLFSNSEFELNRERHGGVVSLWSRSSRSHFGGAEGALSLGGDVRTTMFGADYTRGALVVGLSVGRTLGLGGYSGPSAGQMTSSLTGFYPWVGYQVNDRVSVWGVTGYGTGALSLAPDGAAALETGLSMAMTAAGTRGELIGSRATGGFALAFKADALWVGAATGEVDGSAGRLSASEAGVTRVRTALEGSRGFTVGGRVSLTPSVEIGLRQDGGDAETGAGMDVGSGLVLTDALTGLSAGRAGADAGGAPVGGVHRAGDVVLVRLGPDAVEPAGADGAVVAVVGRVGDGGRRGAVARTDGLRAGLAPGGRLRRPARRGGGLWAAGGEPLRGDAAGGARQLGVRPGLPGRLRPRRARHREPALRAGRRRAPPGEPVGGRRGRGDPRPRHLGLVAKRGRNEPGSPSVRLDAKLRVPRRSFTVTRWRRHSREVRPVPASALVRDDLDPTEVLRGLAR